MKIAKNAITQVRKIGEMTLTGLKLKNTAPDAKNTLCIRKRSNLGESVRMRSWFYFPSAQQNRPVAQLAERLSPKQEAVGSIPTWPA